MVEVPRTGDREIDELGEFISQLGADRRSSRVMAVPKELLRSHASGAVTPATGAKSAPTTSREPSGTEAADSAPPAEAARAAARSGS